MTPCVERLGCVRRGAGMQSATETIVSPVKDDCLPEGVPCGIEGWGGIRIGDGGTQI